MNRVHSEVHTDVVTAEAHDIKNVLAEAALAGRFGFTPLPGSTVNVTLVHPDPSDITNVQAKIVVTGSPPSTSFSD